MEDRKLEAAESLALISQMIENTRNRMVRHSGRPFLIWGYTTVAVTAAVAYSVFTTGNYHWNFLWFALPVIGTLLMWLTRGKRPSEEGYATSFVDRTISQIWAVMGSAAMFISILSMFAPIYTRIDILFIILLMMSMGSAITCLIIRFTAGIIGGILGIILAPMILIMAGTIWIPVIFAAGFVVNMIIPGHILNYKSRQLCSKS